LQIVEVLLAFGANVHITDGDGVTPLMSAAAGGHVEIIRMLLKLGVEIDQVAHSGGTALMYAAGQGHLDACRVLIEEGNANPWIVVHATSAYKEQVNAAIAAGGL
jgi:ankyrin repeat protein